MLEEMNMKEIHLYFEDIVLGKESYWNTTVSQ